ncbi:LLM class flavin-dependent oxidoreductase [Pseudonocardia sp. ICBG1293]|uniref:LLM class flavin-dependent oxidoreductase n=1 Tax=Pseudonocardia sp. ICBG1293 TaxID=2844382 RepID=UPI001CC9E267|nr:LLM class flavin-dependent oxidoreductase [Pseudonocardia sp. ICBG1293]
MVPLSVLDLVPVADGSSATDALAHSTRLVRRAEELGFTRYWVAEHHGMPGIASSSPPVLIAHLAGATERITVGSGGVMLPNHRPLVVAEQFGTLEALHPGRIDLGIGRAPGTDPRTAAALRGTSAERLHAPDDLPDQLVELAAYFRGDGEVLAVPSAGNAPTMWLLGSSGYSAKVAGMLGLPFAFAHHFSAANTLPALELYREHFRPSAMQERPYSLIAAGVTCADTDERARELALPAALQFLHLRLGDPRPLPGPAEVAAFEWTDAARSFVEQRWADQVIGSPDTVRAGVEDLVARTGVDELMVTTSTFHGQDRLRSYELLAEAVGLRPAAAAA